MCQACGYLRSFHQMALPVNVSTYLIPALLPIYRPRSGTLRWVIEYGLPLPFLPTKWRSYRDHRLCDVPSTLCISACDRQTDRRRHLGFGGRLGGVGGCAAWLGRSSTTALGLLVVVAALFAEPHPRRLLRRVHLLPATGTCTHRHPPPSNNNNNNRWVAG